MHAKQRVGWKNKRHFFQEIKTKIPTKKEYIFVFDVTHEK